MRCFGWSSVRKQSVTTPFLPPLHMGQTLGAAVRWCNSERDDIPPVVYELSRPFYADGSIDHEEYRLKYDCMVAILTKRLQVPPERVTKFIDDARGMGVKDSNKNK